MKCARREKEFNRALEDKKNNISEETDILMDFLKLAVDALKYCSNVKE